MRAVTADPHSLIIDTVHYLLGKQFQIGKMGIRSPGANFSQLKIFEEIENSLNYTTDDSTFRPKDKNGSSYSIPITFSNHAAILKSSRPVLTVIQTLNKGKTAYLVYMHFRILHRYLTVFM